MELIKKNAAVILCVTAGTILILQWLFEGAKFNDVLGLALGLYFTGKGLFIRETLDYQRKMLDRA